MVLGFLAEKELLLSTRRRYELFGLMTFVLMMSGCAALQGGGRQRFASGVEDGAGPIVKGYRGYVAKDTSLSDDERRMRLNLADEFEAYVKEGKK